MKRIGVLTSGGDAPGMNAAVRSVARTALDKGIEVCAIHEGFQGMLEGGARFRLLSWSDVGGILHRGGTIIGSARCKEFRERPGRLRAARNLILNQIDGLIIIGGDGSLTGGGLLCREWPELLAELAESGEIDGDAAARHASLRMAGIIGSIDNDMYGSDVTTGADTALHRIISAADAISSTAASHQRSFIIEVMGRNCGYLALMGALASGADWVLIPESPPDVDDWESKMCEALHKGRAAGRRDSMVIIAEGARDRHGNPISSQYVKQVLEERLGEDTRITVLGHVQRGGSPSAFDRNLSTILGFHAVMSLLSGGADNGPIVLGLQGNQVTRTPLDNCLQRTSEVSAAIKAGDFEQAMNLRGRSFGESFRIVKTMVRAKPKAPVEGERRLRLAVLHSGGPAPGMNTAVRAAVRLGIDRGHHMLGVYNGFPGLARGEITELNWMSVNGWAHRGGAELGTNRTLPEGSDFYAIARNLEAHQVEGILMIGGLTGYHGALALTRQRTAFPAFNIPIVCLPATINNNLPAGELSVGADTALNNIVSCVDKIKQSAVASRRTFVVEVMGHRCGYLAVMSAMATGAERVYMHEEGVTLEDLVADVRKLIAGFRSGKRLGLVIRTEQANPIYTTHFMRQLFEEEGGNLFDVREAVLGHQQQGGDPSPFDRILAMRFASLCIDYLIEQAQKPEPASACIGQSGGQLRFTSLEDIPRLLDAPNARPREQWWMSLCEITHLLAQAGPAAGPEC